jgi:hypothetical protein
MRFLFFCLSALFISTFCQAQDQLSKIINDPDVVWVSEYLIDVDPTADRDQNKKLGFNSASGSILKSVAKAAKGVDIFNCNNWQYENSLVKIIMENRTEITVYKDQYLGNSYSKKEAAQIGSSVDTILSYDPNSFEEIVNVVINEIDPRDVIGFRQYGIVYYHKKEAQFIVKPYSIAPILQEYDITGQASKRTTLFWIPVEQTKKTNLDSKNTQWVSRIIHHVGNDSEIAAKKQISSFGESWSLKMDDLHTNSSKREVYNVFQILGGDQLTAEEVQNLGNSVDTVISFHPTTFEEIVNVVVNKLDEDDIQEMRIIQDWIWDKKKKQLFIRYLGYAPIIRRYDDAGIFLNSGAGFYLRMPGVK